jgi:hypothetical protein
MRDPEFKDKPKEYTAMERTLIQSALNQARYENKKGSAKKSVAKKSVAKKSVAKKAVAKKAAAPKPKDSRFSGLGAGKPKPSGTGGYTPGSAKSSKSTYTTGSGVRYAASAKKATPAQKTKPRFGGFSIAAEAFTPDWKKREQAAKAAAKKSK